MVLSEEFRIMARAAKTTRDAKLVGRGSNRNQPTRTAAPASAKVPGSAKASAPIKGVSAAAVPVPKVSKDELRAQVEKLQHANATLRTKSREGNRAAKTAAARIAELEDQVARLEQQLAARAIGAPAAQSASSPRSRRRVRHRELDPGDAVPPGVAVEEPAPLDLEAETARQNLEEHLGGE